MARVDSLHRHTPQSRRSLPRRVATLSVHTSPLDQPGTGDAGGMNVYIVEVAERLAQAGVEVEIFTRATCSELPPVVEMAPGVLVRHVIAGPFEGLAKEDLPGAAVRVHQRRPAGRGVPAARAGTTSSTPTTGSPARSAGWRRTAGACRWCTPRTPWPRSRTRCSPTATSPSRCARVIGEEQVVAEADRLVANTPAEAAELVELYGADPRRVAVVAARRRPGPVPPGGRAASRRARRRLGLPAGRPDRRVRRADPAAEGPRRAAARRRRAARAATPSCGAS